MMATPNGALPGHAADHRPDDVRASERVLHASLVRPVLYFGVERLVIAFEATLIAGLIFSVGLHFLTLLVAAVVVLVLHPTMVWLTARDPQITEIYVRSRVYADYYAPHVTVASRHRTPRVRTSVPRVR